MRAQRVHWTPNVAEPIIYRTDQQYEESFVSLFAQAVSRRAGPGDDRSRGTEPDIIRMSGWTELDSYGS